MVRGAVEMSIFGFSVSRSLGSRPRAHVSGVRVWRRAATRPYLVTGVAVGFPLRGSPGWVSLLTDTRGV